MYANAVQNSNNAYNNAEALQPQSIFNGIISRLKDHVSANDYLIDQVKQGINALHAFPAVPMAQDVKGVSSEPVDIASKIDLLIDNLSRTNCKLEEILKHLQVTVS